MLKHFFLLVPLNSASNNRLQALFHIRVGNSFTSYIQCDVDAGWDKSRFAVVYGKITQ